MKRNSSYIRYVGQESPNLVFHDGGLRPAVGTWNIQVMRANRTHPGEADGVGNTYNHAPNLTYWNHQFYLAYLSNPVSEHTGPGQTFLCTSKDALSWSRPQTLFPPYALDLSLDNGPHADLFEDGNAYACMHQRMNFYIAPDSRLIAVGYYGLSPEVATMPGMGYGIGRVVREMYPDGSFGPIYFAIYNTTCGYNRDTCTYPFYQDSPDAGFVKAVDNMLSDKLTCLQFWEENRDYPDDDLFAIRGAGEAFNYYKLPDGRLVGLWKKSRVSISEDDGKTWAPVQLSPSLVMSGGKVWGERTEDGKYALCYNPNTDSTHRWPLAVVTSDDGIEFKDMLYIHGEVPMQRFWGFWRDNGPNYMRGLEAGAVSPDGAMYLTYSVNKEDIWVSRVPVSITDTVDEHVKDHFDDLQPRSFVPGWNVYSGAWSRVSLETIRHPGQPDTNALRLRSKDPYDYAVATRVFPRSERVRIHTAILARQNYFGCMEIDLTDGRGVCIYRVTIDQDRTVKLKHGNGFTPAGIYDGLLDFVWEVDCIQHTVTFTMNGGKPSTWYFYNHADTVERMVFRTGYKRRQPYLEDDREFMPPDDLPDADEPLKQESVYYITQFDTQEIKDDTQC